MIDELSIIIPVLNEEKYLPRLLKSIVLQDYKGRLEVIVVDGASEDKTIEVANSFKDKISDLKIISSEQGVGNQRNVGARKAQYKYLLFLDADMMLPKQFLSRMLKKIHPDERFIATVAIFLYDGSVLDWVILLLVYPLLGLVYYSAPTTMGSLTLTTKENHIKINGYKENTLFGEDADYGWRSVKNGAKPHLFYTPVAYTSSRRAKEMGMIRLLLFWLKSYLHVKKHGVIYKGSDFHYPYGKYSKN